MTEIQIPKEKFDDEASMEEFLQSVKSEIEKVGDDVRQSEAYTSLLNGMAAYSGEDRLISSHEMAEKLKQQGGLEKIYSGWIGLDDILGGFTYSQVVTITAPTKNGKTSWCFDLTERLVEQNPVWFPFEEGANELIGKCLENNQPVPLFYAPNQMINHKLPWIEKKIIEGLAKFGSRVFFIDHLHFVVDFSGENMSLQIGRTMRELKRIAKTWNVLIFMIAHLKKTQVDVQPTLEDIRDSSFIAQESDTVLVLWRQTKKEKGSVIITNNTNLSVQANRRTGRTGNVKLVYREGKFHEEDWLSDSSESGPTPTF